MKNTLNLKGNRMKKTLRTSAYIFLTFIILTQNICFGNDYSKGILNRDKVYETSKTITNNAYPNSDEVLIDNYMIEDYNPDGTSTVWDDTFMKVLTEKGKRSNKTQSFYYTLPYSTVELTLLEIIKPNGTVQDIDVSKQSRIMINNTQMNSNIYNPNSKILKLNIPDLQVGDIIRSVIHRKQVKARMPNTWSDYSILESTSPIKHLTLEIISPNELPLKKINLLDELKETVSYTSTANNKTTTHKWEVKDVPRMFPEPKMPPLSSVVQRLLVSTVADWQTISRWYWDLCLPHINATTPAMKEKVSELIKGKNKDMEKVEAIYYYVSQKIRYMGITTEKDAPGYEPHDVNITFENKYGVCRDKAALLVAMLKLAGFKSYPVLVKVGPKMDKEVPMINFNHAIACVELIPGQYTLMDPTDENSKQLLPPYLCDQSYLVAKPNGDTLQTTPIIPADKNLMQINTTGKLDSITGKLTASVQLNFDGINDNAYRGFFAGLTPDDRQRFFEKVVRKILPTAKVITLEISPQNMHDTSKPLFVNIEYEAENILIRENKTAMLPLPWFGKTIGIINYVISDAGLEKRKYPLKTSTTCGYKETLNIKFKNGKVKFDSIPNYTDVNTETITYKQKLNHINNTLKGTSKFLLKVVEFSPKQYLVFKDILEDLEQNQKKMPILSFGVQQTDVSDTISKVDARILETKTEIILKDQNSWTENYYTKMKILSYPGKKKYSEIKFPYNPVWESVKINKAVVIGKNGEKKEISKEEMNIMDASWTGSAPRYPSEKLLVLNLPGVEIGSIIELHVTTQIKDRPFFSDIKSFRKINPVKKASYKISVPKDIILKIARKNLNGIIEKKTELSNYITYEWSTKNQKALKKESSLPPAWTFLPTVIVSTGYWKKYSGQLNRKFIEAAEIQPEINALAKKLTDGQNSIEDKISAIRDYTAKNIRQAGPAFTELPLTAISSAAKTLSDSYGNNLDRAIVLYSMLKAANLNPEFVLASSFPAIIKQITEPLLKTPQLDCFNEVLIALKIEKDNTIYLNDTNEYSVLGATMNEYNLGLNLNNAAPLTIKPLKNRSDKISFDFQIKLDNTGDATMDITKKYYGNYFGLFNKKFSELRPEQRDRYYQSAVANISQSAEPISKLVTDFENYPGTEKFSVKVSNYSIVNNNFYYFNIPLRLNNIFNLGKDNRFYPYYQDERTNLHYNINVQLPESFNKPIIIPQEKCFSLPKDSGKIDLLPIFERGKSRAQRAEGKEESNQWAVISNQAEESGKSKEVISGQVVGGQEEKTKGKELRAKGKEGSSQLAVSCKRKENNTTKSGNKEQYQWNERIDINIQPSIFNPEQYNEILKIDKKISSPSIRTILLAK